MDGSFRTRIVYGANLNFKILKRYLDFLQEHGMIEKIDMDNSTYYRTTEKGKTFLKHYSQLQKIIKTKEIPLFKTITA